MGETIQTDLRRLAQHHRKQNSYATAETLCEAAELIDRLEARQTSPLPDAEFSNKIAARVQSGLQRRRDLFPEGFVPHSIRYGIAHEVLADPELIHWLECGRRTDALGNVDAIRAAEDVASDSLHASWYERGFLACLDHIKTDTP